MMTPQLVGIVAGCVVFAGTVVTVLILLIAGGSLERLRLEAANPKAAAAPSPLPRLTDVLLTAAKQPSLKLFEVEAGFVGRGAACPRSSSGCLEGSLRLGDLPTSCRDGTPRFGIGEYVPATVWSVDEAPTTVVIVEGGEVVGALGLSEVRPSHLTCRLHLLWLHPAYLPRGGDDMDVCLGHLALAAALDVLFFDHNLRRVEVLCDVADAKRRKLFEAVGFTLEGVLRKHMIVEERNRDSALASVLNTDWKYGPTRPAVAAKLRYQRALPTPRES